MALVNRRPKHPVLHHSDRGCQYAGKQYQDKLIEFTFDSQCVPHYARIRDQLEREGQIIGGNDLMIAAIALANNLTLLTHNGDEFQSVPRLRIEDWVRAGV